MAALSDHEGQRLVSTQTVQHDYLTLNGKVVRETITTDGTVMAILDFVYDESGRPFALNYSTNGGSSFKTYYYILNLQGDVVKLVWYIPGFEYEEVANYTYDAWGNILTATGDMAEINPLRYRGYYYDSETGFYYLQSRYYDPVNRRFINADVFTSTGQGILGTNMFAYCLNNPVSLSDPSGMAGGGTTATKMKSGLASATASLYGAALILFFIATKVDNDSDVLPLEELLRMQGKTHEQEKAEPEPPDVTYPGDDPAKAPDGYEWRGPDQQGGERGGYANPNGKDSWHPDLNHPDGIPPHWDYNDGLGHKWRVFPDHMEFVLK